MPLFEWDADFEPGSPGFWAAAKGVDGAVGRKSWMTERFENTQNRATRNLIRAQLIAEIFGWAEPC